MTDGEWLYEYQKLMTNVRWWINHGLVETATKEIDTMALKWGAQPARGKKVDDWMPQP
jgi:hypothetical protein